MAKLLAAVFTVVLLSSPGNAGQGKPTSIQGVWQAVEVTITGPGARTIAIPEPRPNLTIFTARHYSRVEVQAEGPRPIPADVAKASADELRAAWGPFVGEAGTYEVTNGNLLTVRPIAAKNPAVMGPGVFITYSYKLEGDTMWVTQQRNQNGPFPNPVTFKSCASNDAFTPGKSYGRDRSPMYRNSRIAPGFSTIAAGLPDWSCVLPPTSVAMNSARPSGRSATSL